MGPSNKGRCEYRGDPSGFRNSFPHLELAGVGHLVPMVGLGREVAAVVDADRVAGTQLHDGLGSPRPEHSNVVDDGEQTDPRPTAAPEVTNRSAPMTSTPGESDNWRAIGTGAASAEPLHPRSTPPRARPGCLLPAAAGPPEISSSAISPTIARSFSTRSR